MGINDKDSFEILKRTSTNNDANDNFFLNKDKIVVQKIGQKLYRHINDYDANLLENDAYKNIDNDIFKIEYKISRISEELKELNKQIDFKESINDSNIESVINKREELLCEYKALKLDYEKMTISSKLTSKLTSVFDKNLRKHNSIEKSIINFLKKIFLKMPTKIKSLFYIKDLIFKLIQINNSVDNLISDKAVYKNTTDKYKVMSEYIIKANTLQKNLKNYIKRDI